MGRARRYTRRIARHAAPLLALVVAVCIFYAPQLVAGTTLWDGADVHYSAQRYLSDALHAGRLPFWTPYLFAGFPFLADVQVGAWYPLNWPFFLAGITPNSMSVELLLHGLIACAGTYALMLRLVGQPMAALAAALLYGLSGYFAAHAQHVGMVQTASWLPWLLLALDHVAERLSLARLALLGLLGAAVVLPGHFQTALYASSGAATWAVLDAGLLRAPRRLACVGVGLLAAAGLGGLLAAVMVVPGLELVRESVRTQLDASTLSLGYFRPDSLLTLVNPDYYGLLSGHYSGPGDITQHYFYAGSLLVPLAVLGSRQPRVRRTALLLILPFVWYALGPAGGLFRLLAKLPGFHSVELPMHGWFLPALGLALLAGAGLPVHLPRLSWLLVIGLGLDLVVVNQLLNPLAFARQTSDARYFAPLRAFEAGLAEAQPVERLHGPQYTPIGYRNYQLQARVETTYGYNPLEILRFAEYMAAADANPRLLDGLAVSHVLHVQQDGSVDLVPTPSRLPLAFFAQQVSSVSDEADAVARLADPAFQPSQTTLVVGRLPGVATAPDPAADVQVVERGDDWLRLRYRAASAGLVRVGIAWFPGWQASLGDARLAVLPVDHALLGVVVPAGEGDVWLGYVPRSVWPAAITSGLALLVCLAMLRPTVWLRTSALYRRRSAAARRARSAARCPG